LLLGDRHPGAPLLWKRFHNVLVLLDAVIETGFVGRVHIEAIRRLGFVEIAAIVDTNWTQAEKYAAEFCVLTATIDYWTVAAL
jgi:hypothetical protein